MLKIARAAATDTDGEMTVALGLGWLYPVVVVAAAGEMLALPFSLDPELVPELVVTGGQDAFGLPLPLAVPAPPPVHHKCTHNHNTTPRGEEWAAGSGPGGQGRGWWGVTGGRVAVVTGDETGRAAG